MANVKLVISKDRGAGEARYKLEAGDPSGSLSTYEQQCIVPRVNPYRLLPFQEWMELYGQYVAHIHAYLLLHLTNVDNSFIVSTKYGQDALVRSLARFIYEHSSCAMKHYNFFK